MNMAPNPPNDLYESPVPGVKSKPAIETGTRLSNSFEVITGDAVIALLSADSGFQTSWDLLFKSCPWATVFQSRAFITAWYQTYREKHCPLLIIAVENGQLKGVLPLALLYTNAKDANNASNKGRITAAGHYEAQYHAWLVAPSDGDAFIKKALAQVLKQFPGYFISIRFLPSNAPMKWVTEDRYWRKHCIVQTHSCPLIHLKGPESDRIFQHKKHFKHKLNRLKRQGEVRFDTITDLVQFERILNEMILLYDFRQSALYNKNPFKEEPAKKDFLLALFHLQLLHITVLRADEKMIAAVVAVGGKDWIYLSGINCHTPHNSRTYSPGFLHFVILSQQLAREGVHYFDLSPGYDPYKEDLANQHEDVHELIFTNNRSFRIKRRLKKWVHARLIAAGKRPMTTELNLKYFAYLAKERGPASLVKDLFKRFQKKEKQQHYKVPAYTAPAATRVALNKDNITDLRQFNAGKKPQLTRWEFLGDANYRFERGHHCYTWIENGVLLACAWVNYKDPQFAKKDENPEADNSIELGGLYFHASAMQRITGFINEVIDTVVNKEKKVLIKTNEPLFCKALEEIGNRQS